MAAADDDFRVGHALPALVDGEVEHHAALHPRLAAGRAENGAFAVLFLLASGDLAKGPENASGAGGVQVGVRELCPGQRELRLNLQASGAELQAGFELRHALVNAAESHAVVGGFNVIRDDRTT